MMLSQQRSLHLNPWEVLDILVWLCHTPPRFNLMEPCHAHTHLMMDHDLTQSRHCHAGQCRTVSDLAISDISGHLRTGRDSTLTAHTLHSATFSVTYFLIQLITFMYICI